MNRDQFRQRIQNFQFTELFNDLGWNYIKESHPVKISESTFTLHSIAEKSGFRIMVCDPEEAGRVPDSNTRKKLDNQIAKTYREHLIIFIDKDKTRQVWQLILRQAGKPPKFSEVPWNKGQDPELLYQKASGLIFTLDEEEQITIVDVTQRMTANFVQNNERVTKKFYTEFKTHHTAFLKFIKGIEEQVDREW